MEMVMLVIYASLGVLCLPQQVSSQQCSPYNAAGISVRQQGGKTFVCGVTTGRLADVVGLIQDDELFDLKGKIIEEFPIGVSITDTNIIQGAEVPVLFRRPTSSTNNTYYFARGIFDTPPRVVFFSEHKTSGEPTIDDRILCGQSCLVIKPVLYPSDYVHAYSYPPWFLFLYISGLKCVERLFYINLKDNYTDVAISGCHFNPYQRRAFIAVSGFSVHHDYVWAINGNGAPTFPFFSSNRKIFFKEYGTSAIRSYESRKFGGWYLKTWLWGNIVWKEQPASSMSCPGATCPDKFKFTLFFDTCPKSFTYK